jgi:hypothetical protein
MDISIRGAKVFRHYIAIPQDHGSWVFLLSPLIIGFCAGRTWGTASLYLILGALSGFLIRQPMTIAIKILSGRRPRSDLYAAVFWAIIYSAAGILSIYGLMTSGMSYLLLLVIPALFVFAWHLILVTRRAERRQVGVEIAASGVLALAAPAAFWVGSGHPAAVGWLLWLLTWLQSAASIVYAYMRLEQRNKKEIEPIAQRLSGKDSLTLRAWLYSIYNLITVVVLASARLTPAWLSLPYAVQLCETLWGSFHPAAGLRPTAIGFRQLMVSAIFTVLFIITWNFGH